MTTASQDTAGFSRLGGLIPATITIRHGPARAMFSLVELEQRLGLPGLGAQLLGLAVGVEQGRDAEAERGRGSSNQVSGSTNANADRKFSTALAFQGKDTSEEPPEPARASSVDNGNESFARYLAQALGDTTYRNMAFYRKAVRTVPRHILQDALGRAKDARDIRKSRAQLFTFLVRDHMPKGPNNRL